MSATGPVTSRSAPISEEEKERRWKVAIRACKSRWWSTDPREPAITPFPQELVSLITAYLRPEEREAYCLSHRLIIPATRDDFPKDLSAHFTPFQVSVRENPRGCIAIAPLIPLNPYLRDILFRADVPRSLPAIGFFDKLSRFNRVMHAEYNRINLDVTEFSLSGDATDATLQDIATRFPNLRSLDLSDCKTISDAGLAHLSTLPLQSLDLSHCYSITNEGLAHLSGLPLHSLSLKFNTITNEGLAHLRSLPLRSLNLAQCDKITDEGLAHLASLPLQSLVLNGCSAITNEGMAYLSHFPLKSLSLSFCSHITDAGLVHLSTLPLQTLQLNQISDAGLAYLSQCPLQSLSLWNCRHITDAGLAHLSTLPLQSLDLENCHNITNEGLAHLSGLPLHSLSLRFCDKITDEGLAHLSTLPLQSLDLTCGFPPRRGKITDQGLAHLSGLPLQSLTLWDGEIFRPPLFRFTTSEDGTQTVTVISR